MCSISKSAVKKEPILEHLFYTESQYLKDMTTGHHLNHFMRTKLNLNPQVLSKNTTEMVSTCIEQLYKQVPTKFKNGLQQIKVAGQRLENQAPVRKFKAQEGAHQSNYTGIQPRKKPPLASNVDESLLLNTVMNASRKRFLSNAPVQKKLLKPPPTYKIYPRRRYGSSASSSSGSLWRRKEVNNSRHAMLQLKKSFSMIHGQAKKPDTVDLLTKAAAIGVPARNQHMHNALGSVAKAMEVSSNIQRDLMVIDDLLKNRLRTVDPGKTARRGVHTKVRDNPPPPQLFQCRNEQIFANFELQKQFQRLQKTKGESKQPNLDTTGVIPTTPSLLETKKRSERFASPFNMPREAKQPNSYSTKSHLPLTDRQQDPTPKIWNQYQSQLNYIAFPNYEKHLPPPARANLEKPYKINGRITSTGSAARDSTDIFGRSQHYQHHTYSKFSTAKVY